ncbi:MarC family protein [Pseudorhodobacter wandonensis]|jgi:multiple antibiotic resistance protein|uniref:MarC family protein n=1 Tax=Pseudorhodobacter wandonensis TaxID=1120568 RepID=UPI00067E3388|nr:MarC family protein [Pseudorhodobacter wandonensis]
MAISTTLLQEFITLWVVIDPIGTLPVFLAVTFGASAATARRVAVRAVLIAFAVLLTFVVFGQLVLDALGLGLPSFQIAGGLVLLLFALSMIFGTSKPEAEVAEWDHHASAVYPLAMPSIASPGAMLAVVVLTDNDRFSVAHQAMTAGLMAVVLAITLVILLLATPIHRVIGATGASIVSRVMGMILAAVAVDAILKGFVVLGVIAAF